MIYSVLSGIITGLIIAIIAYIAIVKYVPKMIENQKILIKNEIEEWLNSEKGQKAIFLIGGLAANGIKSGFNISGKSGKFKWQELAADIIDNLFRSKMNVQQTDNTLISIPEQPQKAVSKLKSKY